METLAHTFTAIKETVVSTFTSTSPEAHPVSKAEITGLEEAERARRIEQASQSRVDKENAANLSTIIKGQNFPVFHGQVSKGYKRVTTKYEEEERRRRLTNKAEASLRRANANKTARMISSLGWPFVKSYGGPEFISMDPTRALEEEERVWRTSSAYWEATAKHNAAVVANILRWNNFQRNTRAGSRRFAKFLEEKERSWRLSDDVTNRSMDNAYREASLIRHMGPPFYVQSAKAAGGDLKLTHQLEEMERARRLRNPAEKQLARELAGVVSASFQPQGLSSSDKDLEEQERQRREGDFRGQLLAKANARNVSLMVRESSVNKISGPMWFSISRNSMRALEEIERTRRMRDTEGQRNARLHAKQVSSILLEGLANSSKPGFVSLEEEERQSRILDRAQQHIAVKNARKVSGLVAKHFLFNNGSRSYALAMEESERERRLQDREQERLARANASKVSSLVSSLKTTPVRNVVQPSVTEAETKPLLSHKKESAHITKPLPPLPIYDSFVATEKKATTIPVAPPAAAATPLQPIVQEEIAVRSAPVEPLAAPIPPVSGIPIVPAAAPATSPALPFSAPIAPVAAPIAQPYVSPIVPITGIVPATTTAVPVTPLSSPPSSQLNAVPIVRSTSGSYIASAPAMVPIDQYATGQPPLLGERERKRLAKEADKHNRKAEKDVRKAEASMQKAQKMHQKGRDDKALKLENKANHLIKLADNERKWATGLQGEILHPNSPAPATM